MILRACGLVICFVRGAGWIRRNRRVFSWNTSRPLFSERNGYRTPFLSLFGIRFFWELVE